MIIKEKPTTIKNAIGYTDFTAIYLNNGLFGKERELVRKHELSHIWLGHNLRGQQFRKDHKNVDHYLLNIAMDLEIAKHIYDENDNLVLSKKRSILNGCIKTSDCDQYPKCQYFEEYYLELEKDADKQLESWDAKLNKFNDKQKKTKSKTNSQLVEETKKKLNDLKKQQNIQKIQEKLKEYKIKPSLSSEIDAIAGRQKIKRISSYRRPSRIEHSDFFKKGVISRRKTPKITVYVDRSGSFDSDKTQKATETLKNILQKYRGQVDNDTLYFNDKIYVKDPETGNGGTNHQIVVDEIIRSNSELSIIITDDDYGLVNKPERLPKTIIIPIGCQNTPLARELGVMEMTI